MSLGTGYIGSPEVQTSVANEEIIPLTPENWTRERYKIVRFSFRASQDCSIKVNEGNIIFIEAGKEFSIDEDIPAITSFKIQESGIEFTWAGVF